MSLLAREPNAVIKRATSGLRAIGTRPLPYVVLLHEKSDEQGPRCSRSLWLISTSVVGVFTPTYCTVQEHVGPIATMMRHTSTSTIIIIIIIRTTSTEIIMTVMFTIGQESENCILITIMLNFYISIYYFSFEVFCLHFKYSETYIFYLICSEL